MGLIALVENLAPNVFDIEQRACEPGAAVEVAGAISGARLGADFRGPIKPACRGVAKPGPKKSLGRALARKSATKEGSFLSKE
jgi:hypothetical protein